MCANEAFDIVSPSRKRAVGNTLGALEDLSPEDWTARPEGLAPIIWQIGHLALVDATQCRKTGLSIEIPDGYEELFNRGTSGDGPFPPAEEVVEFFKRADAGMIRLAQGDPSWPLEKRRQVGEMLTRMLYHLGYHLGKISSLRALLKKKRLT